MGKFDFVGTTSRVLSNEKYPGCPFQSDSFLLSFDFNCSKTRTGNSMPTCRSNPAGDNTYDCLLPDHSEMRNKIIYLGADVVLTQPYTAEEVSLQSYALIRRYTEWKSERKEEIPVMVGKLKILPLQRTVQWEHKRILL